GQTVDSHRLMKIRSVIGFFMALRTGTEEDSREAIGSSIAAHLPEKGKEGTGYLREGMRPPREFRAFYSSPPFVPPPGELPPTVVDTIVDSLRTTGARPPRQLWLPPLGTPATADQLVRLVRGKPWDADYGKTPGLAFPVG